MVKGEPSAWANDTMHGWLYAWEPLEGRESRNSFGYWRNVERRMIRALLRYQGHPDPDCYITQGRWIERHHAKDYTYREISAAFSARARPAPPSLTPEEWEHLFEHFAGANDPTAQSIWEKAAARIGKQ